MAIQSEFHKDLSKFEATYKSGMTKSQMKMIIQMIPGFVVIGVEIFFIQGLSFWILSLLTATLMIAPPILKNTGRWQKFKTDVDFMVKHQNRTYQTGKIRRYEAHEFTPKKGESEIKQNRK
jgi:hypothetical protein